MPGEYVGDQATVLPDNTQALLHFSDQFNALNRQRQAEKMAMQQQDQQRKDQITSYLGNRLSSKDFQSDATYSGMVNSKLEDLYAKGVEMKKNGASLGDVAAFIEPQARIIAQGANNVKALDENILARATELEKQNPGLDKTALMSLARDKASFQKDTNGNHVQNDMLTIDPNQDYVGQAYLEHYPVLYSPQASAQDLTQRLDNAKLADVSKDNVYDDKGNLVQPGFKGKLPDFAYVTKDANGKPMVDVYNKNYRLPGANTDYTDQNGKPVKVASDTVFSKYYNGALGSGIEKKVATLTAAAGQPTNSAYADMLRRKFTYDLLQPTATERYKLSTPEDKSAQLKHQAFSEAMQTANLRNSNARLGIAETALKMRENKAASGANGSDYVPDNFLGTVNDTYGTDTQVVDQPGKPEVRHWFGPNDPAIPATYKNVRIIPVTADPKDLNIFAGKANAKGERPVQPKTFTSIDGTKVQGWEYDPTTGNAFGADGVEINKTSVQREFLNHMKKGVFGEVSKQPSTSTKKTTSAGLPVIN